MNQTNNLEKGFTRTKGDYDTLRIESKFVAVRNVFEMLVWLSRCCEESLTRFGNMAVKIALLQYGSFYLPQYSPKTCSFSLQRWRRVHRA